MESGVAVSPPVEEGEKYNVEIEDIGKEGDGVAKIDNFVIFVPDTEVGDEVEIEITRVLRTLAFGEVVGEGSTEESEEIETETESESEEDSEVEEISVDEIELE